MFIDSKLSDSKLNEIWSRGGIPSPQDGSFRFKRGTVSQEYIDEQVRRGYKVRYSRDYVEFTL